MAETKLTTCMLVKFSLESNFHLIVAITLMHALKPGPKTWVMQVTRLVE